jgi:hypothetical protein
MASVLIGLGFRAGAGKDTVADLLVKNHGFVKLAFSAPLKDAASVMFGWPRDQLDNQEFKERIDPFWNLTPRTALQRLGTECMREQFDQEFWIKSMHQRITSLGASKIVITDVRFPNEADSIKRWGGSLWLVNRPGRLAQALDPANAAHPSETAMANYQGWDAVLQNNGTLEQLFEQAERELLAR